MSKLNTNPRLPAPGQIDYERAMNRSVQSLLMQTAQQVNDLSEGKLSAKYSAQATIPTSGSYAAGDYVEKSTKSVTTASDSTYVVQGWIRLTSGSLHVLGTDWIEDRHFLSVIFPADVDPTEFANSGTLTYPAIAANTSNDQTLTVTGAATGNKVALGLPAAPTAGIIFMAFVSATNTVTVRAFNVTAGSITPGALTISARVFQ